MSWPDLMTPWAGEPAPALPPAAGWVIEGVIRCPRCHLYLDIYGSPANLHVFIAQHNSEHAAERATPVAGQQSCRAHPDDCPNGPEPHAYYNPPELEGRCPCCVQPGEERDNEEGPS